MLQSTIIETYSGCRINLLDPDPADILIEDIAWSLSLVCRWGGHIVRHHSVGHHSVMVAREVKPLGAKLPALLHDATEGYIGDVVTPLKKTLSMEGYRRLEERWMRLVMQRFDALEAWDLYEAEIHRADKHLLEWERAALKKNNRDAFLAAGGQDFEILTQAEAYDMFMVNFRAYSNRDLFPVNDNGSSNGPGNARDVYSCAA